MLPDPGFVVSLAAILGTGTLVGLLWRRRRMPAALPFLALGGLLCGYVGIHATLYVPGPIRATLVEMTGIEPVFASPFRLLDVLVILAGGCWFLFALQYTGRGGRRATAVVGALWVPIFTVASVGWLLALDVGGQPVGDLAVGLGLFVLTALLIVGAFLVVETAWQRNAVETREAGLLAGGAVVFSVTSLAVRLTGHPAVPPTMILATSLLFVGAVTTYPIFDVRSVVRVTGRDRLIEEVETAVLVVDREGSVRDLNAAAEAAFDVDRQQQRGEPLAAVLPQPTDPETVAGREEPARLRTGDAVLAVTADPVTDARGRQFGHVLRCTDVTDRQRRERRLSVLYQLLSGAVRQRLSTVATDAAHLATAVDDDGQTPDPAAVGADVRETVRPLGELAARTRDVERRLADPAVEPVHVSTLVADVADSVPPTCVVDVPDEPVTATTDPELLGPAIEMLLGTAGTGTADHSEQDGGAIEVSVENLGHGPEIHVTGRRKMVPGAEADDGPGEVTVEVVRLAIESAGGTLTTADSDPDRRTVVIRLPDVDAQHSPGASGFLPAGRHSLVESLDSTGEFGEKEHT